MRQSNAATVHLRSGGVSLLLASDDHGNPTVVHWGAALRDDELPGLLATSAPALLNSSTDLPRSFPLLPTRADGWSGTPGAEWMADGCVNALRPRGVEVDDARAVFGFSTMDDSLDLAIHLHLDSFGILHATATFHNHSARLLDLAALRLLLPLPSRATDILDFTGRWSGERRVQRRPIADGTWLRSSRRGRPGHDSAFATLVGEPGFGFRSGEVWAVHVGWSGNQEQVVERLPEGAGVHAAVMGGGELLDPGEVRLRAGEQYHSPELWFGWSDAGIDGITERFHGSVRTLACYPASPRPLVLNTWEAVYFDHDPERLVELARTAAGVGVERFVLDDGWFTGRRDDRRGLGDWNVDEAVWPGGLRRLADVVHELNMQFGLWFEPEMVNPDSNLARTHPDWLLGERPELAWRNQFALDLAHPDAYTYLLERVDAIVSSCGIDFIKWDHNRDLHASRAARDGSPGVHAHTLAVYRLIDELHERHPRLEIESCASGGARPDLGMLSRTQRLWASDTNDPLERQRIQRWTQTLLPPELIGSHVGPDEAHTTHRTTGLSFRLATALFEHAGLEWDLTTCTAEELARITAWSALYRELRPLLHHGRTVRADDVDEGALLHGIVSDDGSRALFAWVRLETSATAHTPRVPIPGLDPDRRYVIRPRTEIGEASRHQIADPGWIHSSSPIVLSGGTLSRVGVPLPLLNPGNAMLLEFVAIG